MFLALSMQHSVVTRVSLPAKKKHGETTEKTTTHQIMAPKSRRRLVSEKETNALLEWQKCARMQSNENMCAMMMLPVCRPSFACFLSFFRWPMGSFSFHSLTFGLCRIPVMPDWHWLTDKMWKMVKTHSWPTTELMCSDEQSVETEPNSHPSIAICTFQQVEHFRDSAEKKKLFFFQQNRSNKNQTVRVPSGSLERR